MRFGVNYTPSKGWFHSWLEPDWDCVAHDLAQIADLGLDHVRVFPLWPILQPNRTWINQRGLADLRHMVQLAGEQGLDVYSDVLQGHMSSFDFVPSWLVSWHETSMFSDADAVQAQADLVKAVYDCLKDVPHFKGLTIGNECNQFADPSHPRRMKADASDVEGWLRALLDPVRQEAANRGQIMLHSENDAVWYEDGHAFLPRQASNTGDLTAIHSWVFNGTAQAYGSLSQETTRHAEYLVELSKAFADDPRRQVWLQEIGAPENVIDPADTSRFCTESLEHALDCADLYGLTWWCSHDVDRSMGDFPPFEHDLGLFDQEGQVKHIGKAFSDLVREHRSDPVAPARSTAVVVQCDHEGNPTMRAACAPTGSVFEAWMELSKAGERPALVSSIVAADPQALAARGISRCIEVGLRPGTVYNTVSDPSIEQG
ncbi:glycosyl hydrolase [Bifidobacterium aemilianum]|uniref:Glycosyl hydrolase n=1 Tax=Bifidobacterium aemilianum TaxID=2493120 RepID=A0A366KAA9_9BIFI|nr:glycosyl hydrolase [Bifidobacterium aemilianum]RBP98539.1 glycosyl hydrolase [Bifidobacterium aemilianum]